MDQIIEPSPDFNFSKITCSPPNNIGGSYFTRLFFNNKPLYIQTPKSVTKQGINVGKKINYTDLLFTSEDTLFIQWLEDLEEKCQCLINENSKSWFENPLDKGDIENAFNSIIKVYRSGKNYLLRTSVKHNVRIYDESNNDVSQSNLKNSDTIISILEIQGIKFTARNFQIIVEMKQSMIVSPDPFLDECFIKTPFRSKNTNNVDKNTSLNSIELEKEEVVEKYNQNISHNDENLDSLEETNNLEETEFTSDFTTNAKEEIADELDKLTLNENSDTNEENIGISLEELPIECDIDIPQESESITLKKPNQVYYDLYKQARAKAKKSKNEALIAYLEAREIKNTHVLDLDAEDSDSDLDYNLEVLED